MSTIADPVDPTIRAFIREVSGGFARYPDFARMTNAEKRQVAETVREPWRRGGPVMERIEERRIPAGDHTVRVRFYHPPDGQDGARARACLVYLHGGGWSMFSLETHDRVMREYAARSGLIVAGVDYALSPEAKFPAALEEVADVIRWLGREGPGVGIDTERLLIGGDSAGANLAVAASLVLRDLDDGPLVRGLLLNYGAYARHPSVEALHQYGGPEFMLSGLEMETFWTNYLSEPADAANPLASPILADLAGLPPAFLVIAECDILAEQNREMARRLEAAGCATMVAVYRGATHSFLEAVSIAPLARRALDEASDWMRGLTRSMP